MSVIGLRVGPFEIEQEASVPEPGDWYRARRAGMTRRQPQEVLVRLLPPDASPEARAALQREYDTLRTLDDARVPAPVAFYEGTGALALSAPEGAPLTALVEERAEGTVNLSPSTLLDLGLEIAEALQHAHTKGKVHGHLSADVIALGAEGRVVIWGFGAGPHALPSPAWMAPERARSQPVTPSTDQWSLAALLASIVTGKPPWRTDDPAAEARKGDPSAVVAAVEAQWAPFGRLLRRMMDPHPANRFPSLHPVRQELLALARKAGGTSDRRELAAQLLARVPPRRAPEPVEAAPQAPQPAPEPVPQPTATPAPAPAVQVRAAVDPLPAVEVAAPPPVVAPPPRRKPDPLVQEPLPVVRVVWPDDEEPVSTEVVLKPEPEPSGPNIMMLTDDLPNLAAAEDPPSGEDLALDPPSEAPEEEPLLESSEATMVATSDVVKASIEALRAKQEAAKAAAVAPIVAITSPPPVRMAPLPSQPDLESSEVTGSEEMTTLFSSASLDLEQASLHELAAQYGVEDPDREHPTAVPITDPGQTTQDPRPTALSPVKRIPTSPPRTDPYTSDTDSGMAPMTVRELEALAAKETSPAAEPGAESGSDEPVIQRVAPYVAVAMILGMVVLLAWNWM